MNTTDPVQQAAQPPSFRPEFFPLPRRGPDPYFGLGRSSYYDLEKKGMIRLVRLRKRGNIRGKVLVDYDQVSKMIRGFVGKQGNRPAKGSPTTLQ